MRRMFPPPPSFVSAERLIVLVTRNLKSDIIAKKMLDEMLEAHKEDLPQFFNEVKS
ncbi:hypothetical protein [Peribacillus simplex]|uniref:hypothetical protein n=1 Tax=Peribacillus simplex TaxID=1478 RepID=UPI00296ED49C|nr:hypothetical protein [Peribacillus simplex]